MELLEKFKRYIREENLFHPKDRLLLAVSGGLDSSVMCELCKKAGYDFAIAHCNFQLRGDDSDRDEQFVETLSKSYGVPFYVKRFDTILYARTTKTSIEEAARNLRYEWFDSLTDRNDIAGEPFLAGCHHIVTAHHADDNIETVLMKFCRGTGIKGLRGILAKQGKIVRPLLFARRAELQQFVKDNRIEFVTDHTNLENDYTRNYFRNVIIPAITKSFPGAEGNILNNIQRFRETEILYQQAVQSHIRKLITKIGEEVHIPVLKLLKTGAASTVLYEIIKDFGFTAHQSEDAFSLLKSDSGKFVQSATHRLLKNREWLIISPRQTKDAGYIIIDEGDNTINFRDGTLLIEKVAGGLTAINDSRYTAQLRLAEIKFPLLLRKWKKGDYFYPLGMQKKKKLSRFFIDQKLSLIQKENCWVLEMNKKIAWVVGMRIDDRFKVKDLEAAVYSITYLPVAGNQANHSLK